MMEIQDWGDGLTQHEAETTEKVKQAFQASENNKKVKGQGLDVLKSLKSTFPWKGYSGFRFADIKERKGGELDLVIATHCNVLIIELKHRNGEPITNNGLRWYKGKKDTGHSPVEIIRKKMFLLKDKLEQSRGQFTNSTERLPTPKIEFLAVMIGNLGFSRSSDKEKVNVTSLEDFLKLADNQKFTAQFGTYTKYPGNRILSKNFPIPDEVFCINKNEAKSISIGGHYAEDSAIFSHPKNIY